METECNYSDWLLTITSSSTTTTTTSNNMNSDSLSYAGQWMELGRLQLQSKYNKGAYKSFICASEMYQKYNRDVSKAKRPVKKAVVLRKISKRFPQDSRKHSANIPQTFRKHFANISQIFLRQLFLLCEIPARDRISPKKTNFYIKNLNTFFTEIFPCNAVRYLLIKFLN